MNTIIKILLLGILGIYSSTLFAQGNDFLYAQVCFEKNEFTEAIDHLNKHLSDFQNHQEALILRAKVNLNLKDYVQVIKDLTGLKTSKNNGIILMEARAYAGLGNNRALFEKLGQYKNTSDKIDEETIKAYPEFLAFKTSSEWANLWKNWTYSEKETSLINIRYAVNSERYGEASDRLDMFLSKYKTSAEAYYLKGTIEMKNKDYKNALNNFENASTIDKTAISYQIAQASALHLSGADKKALEILNSVLANDSLLVDAYLIRAQVNLGLVNFDKAMDDISLFLKYYPLDMNAQYIEAQINTKSGDYLGAISLFGKLLKSDPSRPEFFIGRADAYLATKTYTYAIKDYSMALNLNPRNVEVYKKRAVVYQLLGDIKSASIDWGHAASLGDIESLNNYKKYGN